MCVTNPFGLWVPANLVGMVATLCDCDSEFLLKVISSRRHLCFIPDSRKAPHTAVSLETTAGCFCLLFFYGCQGYIIYTHIDFNIYIYIYRYGKAVAYRGRGQHAGAACASASGLRKAEAATVAQEELVEEEFEVLHPKTCRTCFAQGVPKTEKCSNLRRKHTTKKAETSISAEKKSDNADSGRVRGGADL